MERQHFNVTHIMIRRESDNVKTNLTSATEIRKGLSDKSYVEHNLANYVPKDVYNKIRENIANNTYYQDLEPLSKIIIYKIRMMKTEERSWSFFSYSTDVITLKASNCWLTRNR